MHIYIYYDTQGGIASKHKDLERWTWKENTNFEFN